MSRFSTQRSSVLGPSARPVAIPDDVDAPDVVKASGVVELPMRVRWSGPPRHYDLADRSDRARVYEQILTEGTDGDVRFYIDVDGLIDLWPDLVLPHHVRVAWSRWLAQRRGVIVPALVERFGLGRLCELASEKDSGFSVAVLVDMLGSFHRFAPRDFALPTGAYEQLGGSVERWRHERTTGAAPIEPPAPRDEP